MIPPIYPHFLSLTYLVTYSLPLPPSDTIRGQPNEDKGKEQGSRHQQNWGAGGANSWNPFINNMHKIYIYMYIPLVHSLFEPWEIDYVKLSIRK